ncbi:putative membrane protein [Duffyella gerundensis]|uniref:Putative membrane protein n=1 Tax=Duffyella gerundensis TaxID=1619313 RepID=A0A0U5KXR2_9GAMM|nr:putative membrane protein [Duffyella gerundensis]
MPWPSGIILTRHKHLRKSQRKLAFLLPFLNLFFALSFYRNNNLVAAR